jgi:recombination protein RecT
MNDERSLAARQSDLGMVLASELERPNVMEALPRDFNRARFVQNTLALVHDNEQLSKMPQSKLVPVLMKGAYLGLDFFNKECYAVPYGQQLQFTPSYKGMVKLAKKFSKRPIKDIYAHIVHDGDEFESGMEDGQEFVKFNPKPFNDGPIVGAFAVAQYQDGGIKVETMSKQQLDAVKRMSKAQSGTAWKFFADEMYRKSVIRRLCKGIDLDMETIEQARILQQEDESQEVEVEVDNPFGE